MAARRAPLALRCTRQANIVTRAVRSEDVGQRRARRGDRVGTPMCRSVRLDGALPCRQAMVSKYSPDAEVSTTRWTRSVVRLPLVGICLLVLGCSSQAKGANDQTSPTTASRSSTSPTSPTSVRPISLPTAPCDLVTATEIQQLLGYPVSPQPASLNDAQVSCTYASADGTASRNVVVRVVDSAKTKGSEATIMRLGRQTFSDTAVDVPALGAGAFCDAKSGSQSPLLMFTRANLVIELNAPSCSTDQRVATLVSSHLEP